MTSKRQETLSNIDKQAYMKQKGFCRAGENITRHTHTHSLETKGKPFASNISEREFLSRIQIELKNLNLRRNHLINNWASAVNTQGQRNSGE